MADFRTLVLGLGNPYGGDDAVGLHVVRLVSSPRVVVRTCARGGLAVIEELQGFREAHVVDAVVSGRAAPGHVWRFTPAELPGPRPTRTPSHEVDLATALRLGDELGYALPGEITCWGVEIAPPTRYAEGLSPAVAAAVGSLAERINRSLGRPGEAAP